MGEHTIYATEDSDMIATRTAYGNKPEDPDPYDGPTYAAIWATTTGHFDPYGIVFGIGQYYHPTYEQYRIYRSAICFDTSSVVEPITDVTLTFDEGFVTPNPADWYIVILNGQPTYPHFPVVVSDYWGEYYSGNGGQLLASDFAAGNRVITFNATGRSWIQKGGTTKLFLRSSKEMVASPPTTVTEYINPRKTTAFLTITYTSAGFIWSEGDKLHFISEVREHQIKGTALATATAGHLFVEGSFLHYVDENGRERKQLGKDTGHNASAGSEGQIWIDDMWIYYVDSSLNVRKLGTWMLGGSRLGVDTILHS